MLLSTLAILLVASPFANGSSTDDPERTNPEKKDYALLVRKIPHMKASLKTYLQLKEDPAKSPGNFEVVICGKVVKKLTNNPETKSIIQKGREAGIRFSACGMSLKKHGVEKTALFEGVKVVPNGIIRIFDLQEKGYRMIEL